MRHPEPVESSYIMFVSEPNEDKKKTTKETDGTNIQQRIKVEKRIKEGFLCAGQTVIIIIIIIAIVFWRINFPHPSSRLPKGFKLASSLSLQTLESPQLAVVVVVVPPIAIENNSTTILSFQCWVERRRKTIFFFWSFTSDDDHRWAI